MLPYECVPGRKGARVILVERKWGCKAYVLVPKADRRKDWEEKAQTGYFVGFPDEQMGYQVLIGDTIVTSVHVLFALEIG